jgi:hypothetical protein
MLPNPLKKIPAKIGKLVADGRKMAKRPNFNNKKAGNLSP